ncbi:MAG: hypothetical protein EOM48_12240 [Bacilli bacterium]|nr:hypothetical protein [Bacilli bacterium]
MKRMYSYYIPEVGKVQQLTYETPLTEDELLINGYRYWKSEKVERYPWDNGKAPNKRAIHHNKRSGKFTRGEN